MKCEGMDDATQDTCREGVCPPDHKCRYVPSLSAANAGSCRCIPPTSSTNPGQIKCEAIGLVDSEKKCVMGVCPPNHDCEFLQSATAADVGKCFCKPKEPEIKCEQLVGDSPNACVVGKCPKDMLCRLREDSAGNLGCRCIDKPKLSPPEYQSPQAYPATTTSRARLQERGGGIWELLFGWLG
jgi:hypothetical protein